LNIGYLVHLTHLEGNP